MRFSYFKQPLHDKQTHAIPKVNIKLWNEDSLPLLTLKTG